MAIPFWDDEAGYTGQDYSGNPHDYVELGGIKTPGVCSIKITRGRKVDAQKSKGKDGAATKITGMEPAKVDIQITIWTPSQYALLNTLRSSLFPPDGKDAKTDKGKTPAGTKQQLALDIKHPEAEAMGIKAVIPISNTNLAAGSKGERSITLTFQSHYEDKSKAKNKTRKVDGSRNNAPLAKPIDESYQTSKFQKNQLVSEVRKPNG